MDEYEAPYASGQAHDVLPPLPVRQRRYVEQDNLPRRQAQAAPPPRPAPTPQMREPNRPEPWEQQSQPQSWHQQVRLQPDWHQSPSLNDWNRQPTPNSYDSQPEHQPAHQPQHQYDNQHHYESAPYQQSYDDSPPATTKPDTWQTQFTPHPDLHSASSHYALLAPATLTIGGSAKRRRALRAVKSAFKLLLKLAVVGGIVGAAAYFGPDAYESYKARNEGTVEAAPTTAPVTSAALAGASATGQGWALTAPATWVAGDLASAPVIANETYDRLWTIQGVTAPSTLTVSRLPMEQVVEMGPVIEFTRAGFPVLYPGAALISAEALPKGATAQLGRIEAILADGQHTVKYIGLSNAGGSLHQITLELRGPEAEFAAVLAAVTPYLQTFTIS